METEHFLNNPQTTVSVDFRSGKLFLMCHPWEQQWNSTRLHCNCVDLIWFQFKVTLQSKTALLSGQLLNASVDAFNNWPESYLIHGAVFQRVILVLAENRTKWNNFCPSRKQYCIVQLLLGTHRTNALTWGHVTCQLPKLCLKSSFSLSLFHKEFVIGRWWCNAVHNKPIKAFLCADGKRSGNMDTSAIYTSQILMHIHTVQRQGKSRQTPWQISAWISFLLESKLFQLTGASFPPQIVATATLILCLPSFGLGHHEQEMCVNACIRVYDRARVSWRRRRKVITRLR